MSTPHALASSYVRYSAMPVYGRSSGVILTIQCSKPSGMSSPGTQNRSVVGFHPTTAFACAPPAEVPTRKISFSAAGPDMFSIRLFNTWRDCSMTLLSLIASFTSLRGPRCGAYSSAPIARDPTYANLSSAVMDDFMTLCRSIHASITLFPKESGSESANTAGRPWNAEAGRSRKENSPAPSGSSKGEISMPERRNAVSYSNR